MHGQGPRPLACRRVESDARCINERDAVAHRVARDAGSKRCGLECLVAEHGGIEYQEEHMCACQRLAAERQGEALSQGEPGAVCGLPSDRTRCAEEKRSLTPVFAPMPARWAPGLPFEAAALGRHGPAAGEKSAGAALQSDSAGLRRPRHDRSKRWRWRKKRHGMPKNAPAQAHISPPDPQKPPPKACKAAWLRLCGARLAVWVPAGPVRALGQPGGPC